jgi:peptidoglycan/xylan/chitin deacetylase (PgdA/CDA1 family)
MRSQLLLTFDDGPDVEATIPILDILSKFGVGALFFVVGSSIAYPPLAEVAKETVARGNWLANHTYNHLPFSALSEKEITQELMATEVLLGSYSRVLPVVRAPYGDRTPQADSICRELGLTVMGWDIDARDWTGCPMTSVALEGMRARVGRDTILLAHDTCAVTAASLEPFLQKVIRANDIELVNPAAWSSKEEGMIHVSRMVRQLV